MAQPIPTLDIVEEDGSPKIYNPYEIKVSDGSLTNNLDGTVSIKTVGTITSTTKFCVDTDNDTCFFKLDGDTSVLTINDFVAIKMIKTAVAYHLYLDDGVGSYDFLLDDGAGGYQLIIQ